MPLLNHWDGRSCSPIEKGTMALLCGSGLSQTFVWSSLTYPCGAGGGPRRGEALSPHEPLFTWVTPREPPWWMSGASPFVAFITIATTIAPPLPSPTSLAGIYKWTEFAHASQCMVHLVMRLSLQLAQELAGQGAELELADCTWSVMDRRKAVIERFVRGRSGQPSNSVVWVLVQCGASMWHQ